MNNTEGRDISIKNFTSRSNSSNSTKIINRSNMPGTGKKINRCRSFHFRYMELCRAKNFPALHDIKAKNNATSVLDFFGDKLRTDDWLLILEALHFDQILQHLAIRLRRNSGGVLEHLDTEKKAKMFKQRPVIFTKYIFCGVVDAVSNCIQFNKNLRVLVLEALPLNEKYVVSIAKIIQQALSSNENLKQISFQRSSIGDKGCEAICSTIKHLASVEDLNLSECDITSKGAAAIADMIKFQKICRYSEGWQKSLRYRDVDPDSIPGLRVILLANNPVGDEGAMLIVEVLKEDVWIKIIDMEQCGLTDTGANCILDCLELNNYITEFNIRGNSGVSKFLQRNIRQQLGKDDDHDCGAVDGVNPKKTKVTVVELKERLKFLEEQIASEKILRKQVELLNEKLHEQILAYEEQLAQNFNSNVPEGYVLVSNESLESIIKERNELEKVASAVRISKTNSSYIKKISKVRKAKSETKWADTLAVGVPKKKSSKSDHEFGSDARNKMRLNNSIRIERNIGDSTDVVIAPTKNQLTARIEKTNLLEVNVNISSSFESLNEADTVRNDFQNCGDGDSEPFKVYIRKKQTNLDEIESDYTKCPSPRTLFLGIDD